MHVAHGDLRVNVTLMGAGDPLFHMSIACMWYVLYLLLMCDGVQCPLSSRHRDIGQVCTRGTVVHQHVGLHG